MAMRNWLFSLQFRLIVGFALVLTLALGSISVYVGYIAHREGEGFEVEMEKARTARVEQVFARQYANRRGWTQIQLAVEQASALYGWRMLISDIQGRVIADSHEGFTVPSKEDSKFFPILSNGRVVGTIVIAEPNITREMPEPAISRLVSTMNQSLLWAGIVAGVGGILMVALVSRQVFRPVSSLTSATKHLGQGDLSQRVPASSRDEIGQLARTFNSMADGLESSERQRRNMVADVAHELRTPLSNIQGYVEAIRDGLLEPSSDTIDTIHQQILYLADLVEDLKLLSETEAEDFRLNLQLVPLDDVIRKSVEAFSPRAKAKGIAVRLDIPSGLPPVKLDRTRIAQVLDNLLENALRHTPSGGEISVLASVDNQKATVTVVDTGEGISPEALPYVFERFYRVDPSRTRTTGGVGLGLTIAKQLVNAHGGNISVTSTVDGGSRFIFELTIENASI